MSKDTGTSYLYKVIYPLFFVAVTFTLLFFLFDCNNPSKKITENDSSTKTQGSSSGGSSSGGSSSGSSSSGGSSSGGSSSGGSSSGTDFSHTTNKDFDTVEDEDFVMDPDTFDINDIKALRYIGRILDSQKTIKASGGFYNPQSMNPQKIESINYKTVIDGYQGQYRVWEITDDNNKKTLAKAILKNLASSSAGNSLSKNQDVEEETVNETVPEGVFHEYKFNDYQKDADSPKLDGVLYSIKKDDSLTMRGIIYVDLRGNSGTANNKKLQIWIQSRTKNNVVLSEHDVLHSGGMAIRYTNKDGNKRREYIIDDKLSDDDKDKLRALQLFTLP